MSDPWLLRSSRGPWREPTPETEALPCQPPLGSCPAQHTGAGTLPGWPRVNGSAFETTSPLCWAGWCLCSFCPSRSWRTGLPGARCGSCSRVGDQGAWVTTEGEGMTEEQPWWRCCPVLQGWRREWKMGWCGPRAGSPSPGRPIKIAAICGIQALLSLACPRPSQLPSAFSRRARRNGNRRDQHPPCLRDVCLEQGPGC